MKNKKNKKQLEQSDKTRLYVIAGQIVRLVEGDVTAIDNALYLRAIIADLERIHRRMLTAGEK